MLEFKILEKTVDDKWDEYLLNSNYATFYQSSKFLEADESRFPIFIYIVDEKNNVKGQLALSILKKQSALSSKKLKSYMDKISNLGNRGTWVSGPIIHSRSKEERVKILEKIFDAINEVIEKFDLILIDGYSPPQDMQVDKKYTNLFKKNNFKNEKFVTFVFDVEKPLEAIWSEVQKYMRVGVRRSEKRGISIIELKTKQQLEEYFKLENQWSKTKGIKDELDLSTLDIEWSKINSGFKKIFLAYKNRELISALKIVHFNKIVLPIKVLSSYSHPTSLGGPILTWTAIKWTKENKMRMYDLTGGEAPPKTGKNLSDYEKRWGGIMKYKRKWGGEELEYHHFIKVQNDSKYKLMRLLMKPDSIIRNYKKSRVKTPNK